MKIAPSILTANFTNLKEEINSISEADLIHIDIMDGNFVENISFGPAITKQLSKISKIDLDVHLMVIDPLKWIDKFSFENTKYITVHYESNDFVKALKKIENNKIKKGISIKPKTPVSKIKKYLKEVDLVLVMSVEPGFGGQKFIDNSVDKIIELNNLRKKYNYNYVIEVDGGINGDTANIVKEAGVDVSVIGSYLFNQTNRNETIKKLR